MSYPASEPARVVAGRAVPLVAVLWTADGQPWDLRGVDVTALVKAEAGGAGTSIACTLLPGLLTPGGTVITTAPWDEAGRGGRFRLLIPEGIISAAGRWFVDITADTAEGDMSPYERMIIIAR